MNSKSLGVGREDGEAQPPPPPTLLTRQGSIYSLTFDEFQSTHGGLGKDFGSMNMDEFLKNIWTAEESYAMVAALGDGSGGFGTGDGLQRQASLTLPRTLSQKTVDQVWRGLVEPSSSGQGAAASCGGMDFPRQPTLGEMTLEEFLVRAGVVREDMAPSPRPPTPTGNKSNNTNFYYGDLPAVNSSAGLELKFNQAPGRSNGNMANVPIAHGSAANLGMTATVARPYAAPVPLGDSMDLVNPQGMRSGELGGFGHVGMNNRLMTGMVGLSTAGVMGASGSPKNHMSSDEIVKGNGNLSSLSPVPYVFNGGGRERKRNRSLDKVVERRQRRMIKNRESAARSRARKQAYTMELEAEVAKLKELNQELQKKQVEMMEMKKNQVLQVIKRQHGQKKQRLRRTRTGPW
ncbi:BZIP transcription factor [Musa troglodytarum]|uniref:BZIP transcription factor n=1 Tax=Musa troglodytarum TaxID=320322 RepID=A0A9E7HLF5_9LILI|nr:BZIP transcription factor [Musa troglodytarum]URE32315.1 BZIP transcription factor [Musa troglodytarum]URE32316.1 BZIP transcription factor [Musa troglodytarum]